MLAIKKYANPKETLIFASFVLLRELKTKRISSVSELHEKLQKRIAAADSLFLPALSLLYVLGKVEYHAKNDEIEYLND